MLNMTADELRGGYSQEQLKAAFDLVANKEHWKGAIDAEVSTDEDLNLISFAVMYFTGAYPSVLGIDRHKVRVVAPGYWAVIGA